MLSFICIIGVCMKSKIYVADISSLLRTMNEEMVVKLNKIQIVWGHEQRRNYRNLLFQCQHVIGRILLKTLLSECLHRSISDAEFSVTSLGKPYMSTRDIYFSISHDQNLIALCISEYNCGVDIQKIEKGYLDIASLFTMKEQEYVFNGNLDSRDRRFFDIWTIKEAYAKYVGSGLDGGIKDTEIAVRNNRWEVTKDRELIVFNKEINSFVLSSITLDDLPVVCCIDVRDFIVL